MKKLTIAQLRKRLNEAKPGHRTSTMFDVGLYYYSTGGKLYPPQLADALKLKESYKTELAKARKLTQMETPLVKIEVAA